MSRIEGREMRPEVNGEEPRDFAGMLRRLRTAAGLSQQALAQRAQVSLQAVSALESGRRRAPYRHTVERLAEALELSPETLEAFTEAAERGRESGLETAVAERSLTGGPRHNLPRQLTSFVGRDGVLTEIEALLATSPLVTIVGTGGVGKTRVAVHAGAQALASWPDGVWFVELAPVGDASLVTSAVASALRVQESTARPLLQTLTAYLKKKKLLLILDNCEHVVDECRNLVAALLQACPEVGLLATSREPLRVAGERVYRIPSLAVPPRRVGSAREALTYGAVTLFADRALAADSRFAVDDDNAPPVTEICRRLDGIPLAIELAAARVRALSVRRLAQELSERFNLLTGGDRTTLPRQQTMRALIDWSHGLLTPEERVLFARLAIFVGGFTLDSAVSVCDSDGGDIVEPLVSLVDKSLVLTETVDDDVRYRLLDSTRLYALEQLQERGEHGSLARRHALSYLALAQRFEQDWYTASDRLWIERAQLELDNWRAALEWSLGERGDAEIGQRLVGALSRVWYALAPAEGRRWVRAAQETLRDDAPADVRYQLTVTEAEFYAAFGQYKAAIEPAERALQLAKAGGDSLSIARALQTLGGALAGLGRIEEGEAFLHEALAMAEQLGNRRLVALLVGELGTARARSGDVAGARAFYARALQNYQGLGAERQAASVAGHLAEVEFSGGDADAALNYAEEALRGHLAAANERSVANDLCNMAAYLVALGRYEEARVRAEEALTASREVQSAVLTIWALQHFAAIAALRPKLDAATERRDAAYAGRLAGFVSARMATLGVMRDYTERIEYERISSALGQMLSDDERAAIFDDGAAWSDDRAAAEAILV